MHFLGAPSTVIATAVNYSHGSTSFTFTASLYTLPHHTDCPSALPQTRILPLLSCLVQVRTAMRTQYCTVQDKFPRPSGSSSNSSQFPFQVPTPSLQYY
jgi:hypothetical protein